MRARDWFGVGVRLFAVWVGFSAVENLMVFVAVRAGLSTSKDYGTHESAYLLYTLGYMALAVCC